MGEKVGSAVVGARIMAERERAGMSQVQLAQRLRTTPATVSRWESGHVSITVPRLFEVAAAIGCPIEVLVRLDGPSRVGLNGVEVLPAEDLDLMQEMANFLRRRRFRSVKDGELGNPPPDSQRLGEGGLAASSASYTAIA